MAASRSIRRVVLFAATCALLATFASPAWAANVLETRVGVHDEYTRIVFELDMPAGYQIERQAAASGGEDLVVSLDANANAVSLPTEKSRIVSGVDVSSSASGAVAHIHLSSGPVRLKEMILANPPRIVLDVMGEEPKPAPKTIAKAAPAPAPEPAVEPEPAPRQIAQGTVVDEDVTAAVPILADEPTEEVVVEDDEFEAIDQIESDVAKADAPAAPAPSTTGSGPSMAPATQKLALATPPSQPSGLPGMEKPTVNSGPAAKRPEPKPLPRAPRKLPPVPAAAPAPSDSEVLFGFDTTTLGLAAVGLVGLVAVGGILMRRRGGSDGVDEIEPVSDDPFAGFDTPLADATTEKVEDDDLPAPLHDDAPVAKGATSNLPTGVSDMEAPTQAVTAIGGDDDLFGSADTEQVSTIGAAAAAETVVMNVPDMPDDDATSGAQTFSDFDTAASFDSNGSGHAAAIGTIGTSGGETRDVDELERRLAQTETRLDEALEMAERLERKVAAQTEELRVQRAAIARTQRAVRNLGRGGEEPEATEPAPKE